MLPDADLTIICDGNPETMSARKREISEEETERQLRAWRSFASHSDNVVSIVTTSESEGKTQELLTRIVTWPCSPQWRSIPFSPRRLQLRTTGFGQRAAKAVDVYQPMHLKGRLAKCLAKLFTYLGVGPLSHQPLAEWGRIAAAAGVSPHGAAAMTSNGQTATVLRVDTSVFKISSANNKELQHEIAVLSCIPEKVGPATTPRLIGTYLYMNDTSAFQLRVFDGVPRQGPDIDQIAWRIAVALAKLPEPITHGDFVPWNLLHASQGCCLIDWQRAAEGLVPGWDLWTWHIQSATQLQHASPQQVARTLMIDPAWLPRYCDALDFALPEVLDNLRARLSVWSDVPSRSVTFAYRVLDQIEVGFPRSEKVDRHYASGPTKLGDI
jgi:hypothetical protein